MDAMKTTTLRAVDRWFRFAGIAALLALGVTIAMLFAGAEGWRGPFVAAHLAALAALLPLGIALVVYGYREAGRIGALLSRHALTVGALVVIAVLVVITQVNFYANPNIRRISNLTNVTIIVLLVVQYLRWFPRHVGRA